MWHYAIEPISVMYKIIITRDNMIAQQNTSNVISNTNNYSHSSVRIIQIKTSKNNNKPWRWWYGTIEMVSKVYRMWHHKFDPIRVTYETMIYINNMISQQSTSDGIYNKKEWSHSSVKWKQLKQQKIIINSGNGDTVPLCWKKTHRGWTNRSNNGKNKFQKLNRNLNHKNEILKNNVLKNRNSKQSIISK